MRYALKLLVGLAVCVGAFAEPCLIGPGGDVGAQANEPYQHATPWRYLVAWEGDDWPENEGWRRNWGNWQGQYQGPGAYRTLENGILAYDSLYDPGVFDYYHIDRPGQFQLDPGHNLILEWRLRIDAVNGAGDPGVALKTEDGGALGYTYAYDHLRSIFEAYVSIPFSPGVWHEYRVIVSLDTHDYSLHIDGAHGRSGTLGYVFPGSSVGFGDCAQGGSSLHCWDYFRAGVTPEPRVLELCLWVIAWRGARRR